MKIARAQEIINNFSSKRILVIGDIVLDQYVSGSVERINPEAPVPILHAHHVKEMTGGAGNVAKNVVTLGAAAKLIGVVGDDDIAEEIETAAQAEGYTPRLIRDPSRPTTRKVRYVAQSQQMLRVDYEETHPLNESLEKQIIGLLSEYTGDCDGIIVSDYAKGAITQNIARNLLDIARKNSIPLAADLKPSRTAWFAGATFISPNLKEAREFLGINPAEHNGHSYADLAEKLHQKTDANVFMTLSAEGIYVLTDKVGGQHVPQAHQVEVADTSGAGDTALAILLLAILSGATDIEAAQLANAAGAVVVSKLGAVGVSSKEVLKAIAALPVEK